MVLPIAPNYHQWYWCLWLIAVPFKQKGRLTLQNIFQNTRASAPVLGQTAVIWACHWNPQESFLIINHMIKNLQNIAMAGDPANTVVSQTNVQWTIIWMERANENAVAPVTSITLQHRHIRWETINEKAYEHISATIVPQHIPRLLTIL